MRQRRIRIRSVLVAAAIAAAYVSVLAYLALQIDLRSFQDQHVRSMQTESLLRALSPESFERIGSIPLIFPWQRMLLIDESRSVVEDSGWLENETLTSGESGSLFASRYAEIGGLSRPPAIDEGRLARLLREAPTSGYFGLLDARTIAAGRSITWRGKGYGVALLADKRDLIAAKHVDHVILLISFFLVLLLPAILIVLVFARLALPLNRLAQAVRDLEGGSGGDGIELPGESRSDEIGLVSAAFGSALREARKSKEQLKDFIDDALHELKNPISSLRGRLELTRMKGPLAGASFALAPCEMDRLLADVGRTERLVASLATLSAADSQEVSGASRPSALLRDLVAAYAALGKPVELEDLLPADAALPVDPEVFSRIVRILVDNALDFSPPGERAIIAARAIGGYATG
jgi:signal transduction histidine kinase